MENLDNSLLRDIGVLSRAIQYIGDVKYKELKLQKGQFTFLTRICENPGISFIELSNMLKVDKTTTTKAVNKLIDAGYAYKTTDIHDKRGFNIMPTEKALKAYDFIIEEENREIKACLKKFTEEEKETVLNLIKRMSDNVNEDWIKIKK